ncbi:MAG: hypothetical protein AAF394_17450 [Planctomycetota bacterium]
MSRAAIVLVLLVVGAVVWSALGNRSQQPESKRNATTATATNSDSPAITNSVDLLEQAEPGVSNFELHGVRREIPVVSSCGRVDDDVIGVVAVASDAAGERQAQEVQLAVQKSGSYAVIRLLLDPSATEMTTLCSGASCVQWDESRRALFGTRSGTYSFVLWCPAEEQSL